MLMESDKVMFEVYREALYTGKYKVVYFTELGDHNREFEINRALAGEHFCDGFLKNHGKDQAKEVIEGLLKRMNDGEKITPQQFEAELAAYMPPAKSAK